DDGVERGAQFVAHVRQELRLVLARLGKLAALVLDFVEQTHVFERNHRLVGKGRDKLNLLVTEGAFSFASQNDNPDGGSFSQKWYPKHGVEAALPSDPRNCVFWIGLNVGNMNGFALKQTSPSDAASVRPDRMIRHVFADFARYTTTGHVKECRPFRTTDRRHI